MGLELEETTSPAGDLEIYVLPGFAWDGYGRQLTLLCAKKLTPADFEASLRGWWKSGSPTARAIREVCGAASRSATPSTPMRASTSTPWSWSARDRRSRTVRTASPSVARACRIRARPSTSSTTKPASSATARFPHQSFPADDEDPIWLVPLGKVHWIAGPGGVMGSFGPRSDDERRQSRAFRRHAGLVTEGVQAANGLIRLRKRATPRDPALDGETLCTADALKLADFDTKVAPTAIDDLVWIEGNLRVLGNERLWGTKLELRSFTGEEDGVPLISGEAPIQGSKTWAATSRSRSGWRANRKATIGSSSGRARRTSSRAKKSRRWSPRSW